MDIISLKFSSRIFVVKQIVSIDIHFSTLKNTNTITISTLDGKEFENSYDNMKDAQEDFNRLVSCCHCLGCPAVVWFAIISRLY